MPAVCHLLNGFWENLTWLKTLGSTEITGLHNYVDNMNKYM